MNYIKIFIYLCLVIILQIGNPNWGLSKDIYIYCYFKSAISEEKRFIRPILNENQEPEIIDGKFDYFLHEYIIDESEYNRFYKYCSMETRGYILVDLKAISIRTSNTSFLFSLGPKGLNKDTNNRDKLNRFLTGFSRPKKNLKKIYENGFKGMTVLFEKGSKAEKLDADHGFHKLSAIYAEFPNFQEFSSNENDRLRPLRQQFNHIAETKQEGTHFISDQVAKDFPRFNISISIKGQDIYHSGGAEEVSEVNINQAFNSLENYYIERLDIPIGELRRNIGLAFHTRTHGFDDQSVYLIEHFLSFGKNVDFRIGNRTHTVHLLSLEDTSIAMKTQTELELSAPMPQGNDSIQIGKFMVNRFMNFDIITGRCGSQSITIEKSI